VRETAVEKYLVEQVEARGGLCEKHVSPGRKGVPDRLVSWPGGYSDWRIEHWPPLITRDSSHFFAMMDLVETKAPLGRLSGPQRRDHARRGALGIPVYVVWTKAHVDEYIAGRGR
jgi:hypothetical protein